MKFGASVSTEASSEKAADQAIREAASPLAGASVDLALLFVSQHHAEHFAQISKMVRDRLKPKNFLGCTAGGVIGGGREIENRAGLTLWLANLPQEKITPFHLRYDAQAESVTGWPEFAPGKNENAAFLLLPDPFTTPADEILQKLGEDFPKAPVFGGLASGGMMPGQNRLFWNERILEEGAIGVMFSGPISIRTVVSQGCRPVGKHFVVTQAEKNVIQTLGGKPALPKLQELFASLSPADQQLFRRGVHVGTVVNELQESFRRGDFIVRNVMGIDPESGAIAIGDYVRKGQTVQFHVRDADSAREDLRQLLQQEREEAGGRPGPQGALLFSCNGRGVHLFGEPNHDIGAVHEMLGSDIPVAGFFAQGEIGPIGGKNFLHGFTASIALFSPPNSPL